MLVTLCILAVIAIHRIWHHEDIAAPMRSVVVLDPAVTPLLIAPLVVCVAFIDHPAALPALTVFACYPALRGAVWLYEKFDPKPVKVCTPCQKNQEAMAELQKTLRTWPKRVIVLGPFDLVEELAKARPRYLFLHNDENKITRKNIRYHALPEPLIQHLPLLIMQGGNATVVTVGVAHSATWTDILKQMGQMRGVSWVHVTNQVVNVPAHHRVVAPGTPLVTVIDAVLPPG
jgi:hypothetical protein